MSNKSNSKSLFRVHSVERSGPHANVEYVEILEGRFADRVAAVFNVMHAAAVEDPRGIRDAERADNSQTATPAGVAAIALANGENTVIHRDMPEFEAAAPAQPGNLEMYQQMPPTLIEPYPLVFGTAVTHLDQAQAMVQAAYDGSSQFPGEMPGYTADSSTNFGPELINTGNSGV